MPRGSAPGFAGGRRSLAIFRGRASEESLLPSDLLDHLGLALSRASFGVVRRMKRVLVVGYPKAAVLGDPAGGGIDRLPVAGFWQRERKEIAIEGEDRISEYRCYKSHHQLVELGVLPNEPDTWLVYILRDPRDIAISSATHFQFDRFPNLAGFFRRFRREKSFIATLSILYSLGEIIGSRK